MGKKEQGVLTVGDQVLRDVEGDLDNEGTVHVGRAHQADDTACHTDEGQRGLVHGASGGPHCRTQEHNQT